MKLARYVIDLDGDGGGGDGREQDGEGQSEHLESLSGKSGLSCRSQADNDAATAAAAVTEPVSRSLLRLRPAANSS